MIHLKANSGKEHNRINPDIFSLSSDLWGKDLSHVLLIEDSWVSGATVQSAAAMLHQQGAKYVTVYCIARIINLNWIEQNFGALIAKKFQSLPYIQGQCPWTLQNHRV